MKLGSEILWLSEADVRSLLTMKETVTAVENAFALHGRGQVQLPTKIYLDFAPYGGDLRAMPAYVQGKNPAAGVKIVNSNAANPAKGLPAVTGIMVLNDPKTGLPLGVFAAGTLTSMRTGAAGGIAAKYLARKNSSVVGLVGCGRQALTQLEALLLFFPVKHVLVWGKTEPEALAFCKKIKPTVTYKLTICKTPQEACAADIIVTTTPVYKPVVKTAWVKPGTHINAIGADAPGKQELEMSLLSKSRVVVDDWGQASHAGEINNAVTKGKFSKKMLTAELGAVVCGKVVGRRKVSDITIFDSTGLAIQDVAVGRLLFHKALTIKKGKVLQFNG
jgi:alanine dehydrogenase